MATPTPKPVISLKSSFWRSKAMSLPPRINYTLMLFAACCCFSFLLVYRLHQGVSPQHLVDLENILAAQLQGQVQKIKEQECIPIYLVPFHDDPATTGEHNHFVVDGILKSPFFRITKNNSEGWLWIVDMVRSYIKAGMLGGGPPCETIVLPELTNATRDRKQLYQGRLTENPLHTKWTVIHTDWSDYGGVHWRCEGMADHVENIIWNKRSIVVGKSNNITDTSWEMTPGRIAFSSDQLKHIPYAVRTDQVEETALQLKQEHGIVNFPNETWNLAHLDRSHNNSLVVCNFWPIGLAENTHQSTKSHLRAGVSIAIDRLANQHNLSSFVGISAASVPGEKARVSVQSGYVRDLLRCQIVVVTQRDCHEDHYRLMEAFAGGAMVMSDPMLSLPYGLEDGKNIVIYKNKTDLEQKILYYAKNDAARIEIAASGWKEVMSRHRSWHFVEDLVFGEIRSQGILTPTKDSCF